MPAGRLRLAGCLHGDRALAGPATVQVDLTDACDQACVACWLHSPAVRARAPGRRDPPAQLPIDVVLRLLDELAGSGCGEIYFAGGGEPLLHPQCWQAMEAALHRGMSVALHTNLVHLGDSGEGRLLDIGVHHLTVSLWAASAGVYAATRPGADPEAFGRVTGRLAGINERKADRPQTKLYFVLTGTNAFEAGEMLALAADLGCDSVEFALADVIPGVTDELAPTPFQARDVAAVLAEAGSRAPWRRPRILGLDSMLRRLAAVADGLPADGRLVHGVPCLAGWTFARVMADGRVVPCLKAHRLPSGSLVDSSFSEVWNGQAQRAFRRHARGGLADAPCFSSIGNGEGAGCGCERGCDNLALNQRTWEQIRALTRPERAALACLARLPARVVAPASGGR